MDLPEGNVRTWTRRGTPARIDDIVEQACLVLRRDGYAGFNLRKIATLAGLRLGSVQYHFPSREALLTAAMTSVMSYWSRAYEAVANNEELPPEERIRGMLQLSVDFNAVESTPQLIYEFFAAAEHEPFIRQIVQTEYRRYRARYVTLLRRIRPDCQEAVLIAFATLMIAPTEGLLPFTASDDPDRPDPQFIARLVNLQFDLMLDAFRRSPAEAE